MPTVLGVKGYRFFFFSLEGAEPPHIHVEHGEKVAKFWLEPVTLSRSRGFRRSELTELQAIIEENQQLLLTRWNEHFSS